MIFADQIARNIPKTQKNWMRLPTSGRMCVNLDENVVYSSICSFITPIFVANALFCVVGISSFVDIFGCWIILRNVLSNQQLWIVKLIVSSFKVEIHNYKRTKGRISLSLKVITHVFPLLSTIEPRMMSIYIVQSHQDRRSW
jgi:hypothetical protein